MFGQLLLDLDLGDELLWEPMRTVPPHPWSGHLPFAFWLIKAMRPDSFVELGTHTGNSYFAACQAIVANRLVTRAFAVDTWAGDSHAGAYDEGVHADVAAFNAAHFPGFSTLLREEFDTARRRFAAGSVDLLHIDGLHTYEAVSHDFETWKDALSGRGLVLFHDTRVRRSDFGVWRFWQEVSARHPAFEFHHGYGLGVLAVGTDQPPPVRALLEAGQDLRAATLIRQIFAGRGEILERRLREVEAALRSAGKPAPERGEGDPRLPTSVAGLKLAVRKGIEAVRERVPQRRPAPVAGAPRQRAAHGGRPEAQDVSLAVPFAYPLGPMEPPRAAAICHVFHLEAMAEIAAHLRTIPFPIDVFISTDTPNKRALLREHIEPWNNGRVEVRVLPNRGRDIAPKLVGFRDVYPGYDYVLHLHSKRSAHAAQLAPWRAYLYQTLLGSGAVVRSVFEAFRRAPTLGMVAPQHFEPVRPWLDWSYDFEIAAALASRMGVTLDAEAALDFPSGSMFWARTAALRPLLDLGLSFEDFPEEAGQRNGTPAHAIERLYFHACERAGLDWLKIADPALLLDQRAVLRADSPAALEAFLRERIVRLLPGTVAKRAEAPAPESRLAPGLAGRLRSFGMSGPG